MILEDIIYTYEAGKLSTDELREKLRELRTQPSGEELSNGAKVLRAIQEKNQQKISVYFAECQRVNRIRQGRPVFWIHGALGDASVYIPLAEKIQRPFYGIQAKGLFDDKTPLTGVKAIASFYKSMIRSIQPQGPYDLGGYSVGGTFAYEVVLQLQAGGQIVQSLTLVDSLYPPHHKKLDGSFYDWLYFISVGLIDMTFRKNPAKSVDIINTLQKPENNAIDRVTLVEAFVNFCMQAGVNKPEAWIRNYIKKLARIIKGYKIADYVPSPLSHNIQNVQFFKNQGGLFFGKNAAHINSRDKDPLSGVDYWSEWRKALPAIKYKDVVVDNHLMLFEDKTALQTIRDYCHLIYHKKTAVSPATQPDWTEPSRLPEITGPGADQKAFKEKAVRYFKKLFSSTLKRPVHQIQAGAPLESYGIDSLMATQLTNQLQNIFGSLSITLLFEYRTIRELTGYLMESYGKELRKILGVDEKREGAGSIPPEPAVSEPTSFSETKANKNRFTPVKGESLDIAIIGLSGRYPQARNIEEYWENLREGRDCITEVPKDRWDWREYYTKDRSRPGAHYSKWGGFIDDVPEGSPGKIRRSFTCTGWRLCRRDVRRIPIHGC